MMITHSKNNVSSYLHASDFRAIALLVTDATIAATKLAEGVHQSILRTLGAPGGATPGQSTGLTRRVYECIQSVTHLAGEGVSNALTRLEPLLQRLLGQSEESPERAAVVSALNGLMGDRLQASANPLALPMTLRYHEQGTLVSKEFLANLPLTQQIPKASSKLLLVLHGLCMNDLQWSTVKRGKNFNHATTLSVTLGYTPIYLRYNSGLHISQNGQTLAAQLEVLVTRWPIALTEISVLAHSMGGLLMRSALHVASENGQQWPRFLKNIVFLGTPHHGAPLERISNWLDVILGSTRYSRPFAKLGQLRSAGVTDLRFGYLLDADWQGQDRFQSNPDSSTPLPLPEGVACFTVAATLAAKRSHLAERLVGDGLVPLPSALGQHDEAKRYLRFAPQCQYIAHRTGHLQLLSSPAVVQQLVTWLGQNKPAYPGTSA